MEEEWGESSAMKAIKDAKGDGSEGEAPLEIGYLLGGQRNCTVLSVAANPNGISSQSPRVARDELPLRK